MAKHFTQSDRGFIEKWLHDKIAVKTIASLLGKPKSSFCCKGKRYNGIVVTYLALVNEV